MHKPSEIITIIVFILLTINPAVNIEADSSAELTLTLWESHSGLLSHALVQWVQTVRKEKQLKTCQDRKRSR